MGSPPSAAEPITDDWVTNHFDHLSPRMGDQLTASLARMRDVCPVAHSQEWGGFWVVSRYEDVLAVAQDWETFSSAQGVTIPAGPPGVGIPAIPEMLDPPEHRIFKRLINAYFTPAVVARNEEATRRIVNRLIDDFVEDGSCEFMDAFANPFPGLVFFDLFLHAPADELAEVNALASAAARSIEKGAPKARQAIYEWIGELVERRRAEGPRGDVVDAVIDADIDGRPITPSEIVGVIQLLLFGGLDTTSGALGQMMIRFCQHPEIPAQLRARPDLLIDAVEELLRLDPPFVFIARTATQDAEIGGCPVKEGEKVLISWASANRDEAEFPDSDGFHPERGANRHIAFGAGPHRCAGSNLARMNLRIAVGELVNRLDDLRLADAAEPIPFHSHFSRTPTVVPITFTPGRRLGG